MMRGILALVAVALLAGCATQPLPPVGRSSAAEHQVIQLIGYAQQVATMSAAQRRREYATRHREFVTGKDTMSRLRLALLLATPGAGLRDASRAAALLEPVARSGRYQRPFALLANLVYRQLNARLGEQRRAIEMHNQLQALKRLERTMIDSTPGFGHPRR